MDVSTGRINLTPTEDAHIGTHKVQVKHSYADGTVENKTMTVTVKADCSKVPFEKLPVFKNAISTSEVLTYDLPVQANNSPYAACGTASVSLKEKLGGVTIVNGKLTIDGKYKGLEPGEHTFVIVQ